ncbi:hypothetical protein T484DRAFT_3091214 [Baffinella frigidus]|nr:hypothetical protein T484DRAFT_3091214 [Cryptophyta sp. CCMP2293]
MARNALTLARAGKAAREEGARVSAAVVLQAACAGALAARARAERSAALALSRGGRGGKGGRAWEDGGRVLANGRTAGAVLAGVVRGLAAKRVVMKRRRARDLARMLAGLQPVEVRALSTSLSHTDPSLPTSLSHTDPSLPTSLSHTDPSLPTSLSHTDPSLPTSVSHSDPSLLTSVSNTY